MMEGLMMGGVQFGLTTLNTGAMNWIATGEFDPNWMAAGISAVPYLFQGVASGIYASNHGGNFWTGKGDYIFESLAYDDSYLGGDYYRNDEAVHQMLESENGWRPGEFGIDDISVEDVYDEIYRGNMYYRGTDGVIYRAPVDGGITNAVSGYTYVSKESLFSTSVKIHMSPHVTVNDFQITLNHEFIHAFHRVSGMSKLLGNQFNNYTETSAYTYSMQFRPTNASIGLRTYQYYGPYNIYNWPNYLIGIR
ncbi:MAG: hypothetical protein GF411_10815 [Candidatus Lokiarchaeota archaeon]|nr:hypothetical protein [Candidatus Lokiarchaeota archaeon]